MVTSFRYLTYRLKTAWVQSLRLQHLAKHGQGWLRLCPSGLPEIYSKHAVCQMKMWRERQDGRRTVNQLWSQGVMKPSPGHDLPSCPQFSWRFHILWIWQHDIKLDSGHRLLWNQNDTQGGKHHPVPLLSLSDSSTWSKNWVSVQKPFSVTTFSFTVWSF